MKYSINVDNIQYEGETLFDIGDIVNDNDDDYKLKEHFDSWKIINVIIEFNTLRKEISIEYHVSYKHSSPGFCVDTKYERQIKKCIN